MIARRSRGTPRIANRLLRRVRDFAQVRAQGVITAAVAQRRLRPARGGRARLRRGGPQAPASPSSTSSAAGPWAWAPLAAAISEETDAIEDIYEPFLLQIGLHRPHAPRAHRDPARLRALRARACPKAGPARTRRSCFETRRSHTPAVEPRHARSRTSTTRCLPRPSPRKRSSQRDRVAPHASCARRGGRAHRSRLPTTCRACSRPGDLLVVNRSRVFPARLLGRREGGGGARGVPPARPRRRPMGGAGPSRTPAAARRRASPSTPTSPSVIETAAVRTPKAPGAVHLRAEARSVEAALERAGHVPLAAVHPPARPPEDRAALPDGLRAGEGQRGRADGGPALHARPCWTRCAPRASASPEIVLHVGPGTFRPVTAEERRRTTSLSPSPTSSPRRRRHAIAAARASRGPRGRRRHHGGAGAGGGRGRRR